MSFKDDKYYQTKPIITKQYHREKDIFAREKDLLMGIMPVRCFFAYSDLSQATVVCAQNKFQSVFFEVFSKLISAFSALIHLDSESSKVPIPYWDFACVLCNSDISANSSPLIVIGKIPKYISLSLAQHQYFP